MLHTLVSVSAAVVLATSAGTPAQTPRPTQEPRPMPSMTLPRRQFMNPPPPPAPAKPASPAQSPPASQPSQGAVPPVTSQPLPGSSTPMGTPAMLPNTYNSPQGVRAVLPTGYDMPRGVSLANITTPATAQGTPAMVGSAFDLGSQREVLLLNGSGFSAAGRVEGDNFRIGFTVGNNPFVFDRFGRSHSVIPCSDICGQTIVYQLGYGWYYPGWYAYSYRGLVVGYESRIDPQYVDPFVGMGAPGAGSGTTSKMIPAAPPATAAERGDLLLRDGLPKEAIEAYKEHLRLNESDSEAVRRYAVALLVDRQTAEGVAMMALAYSRDAEGLAARAFDATLLNGGTSDLRMLVTRTVVYANDVKTGSAWLTVAVLMQAEGRSETARKQVEKARAAGLNREVAALLEKALKR